LKEIAFLGVIRCHCESSHNPKRGNLEWWRSEIGSQK